jgi:DNA repair photolyase
MLQPLLNSIEFMEQNKETVSNRFKGFKDYEIDKVKRLYDWAVEPMPKDEEILHKKNFTMHFREHDKRRKTNLKETFPEMIEFIEECEGLINE